MNVAAWTETGPQAMDDAHIELIARLVAERASSLLLRRVWVRSERGTILAGGDRVGATASTAVSVLVDPRIAHRVPVRIGGRACEVVIEQAESGETISERLVNDLVAWIIGQTDFGNGRPDEHRLTRHFILSLLAGSIGQHMDVLREGQIIGIDLTVPRAVILIDASQFLLPSNPGDDWEAAEDQRERRVAAVIESVMQFFHLPSDTICAYIGHGEIAVLKASSTPDLAAWAEERLGEGIAVASSWADLAALKRAASALLHRLRSDTRSDITIAIGRYHPGVPGLARSYQDAQAALRLGLCLSGANQVHCLDRLGIAAFVGIADGLTKFDLAQQLLSPLDEDPELLETLGIFFEEDCHHAPTASRLAIHRNTLGYRLDKIKALSGLDPHRFDDAVQLRLALLLLSLHGVAAA